MKNPLINSIQLSYYIRFSQLLERTLVSLCMEVKNERFSSFEEYIKSYGNHIECSPRKLKEIIEKESDGKIELTFLNEVIDRRNWVVHWSYIDNDPTTIPLSDNDLEDISDAIQKVQTIYDELKPSQLPENNALAELFFGDVGFDSMLKEYFKEKYK